MKRGFSTLSAPSSGECRNCKSCAALAGLSVATTHKCVLPAATQSMFPSARMQIASSYFSCRHSGLITLEVVSTFLLCVLGLYADFQPLVNLLVTSNAISPAVIPGQLILRLLLTCAICESTLLSALLPLKRRLATTLVEGSSISAMVCLQAL